MSWSEEINPKKTSLCVVPASIQSDPTNIFAEKRSMKAMQACLEGIPLVVPAWIEKCIKNSYQFVEPDSTMYVRSLPTKSNTSNPDFGVAKMAVAFYNCDSLCESDELRCQPLRSCFVYLCGFSCKNEGDFSALARQAGAKEIITKPHCALTKLKAMQGSDSSKFVVLCNDSNAIISDSFEKEIRNASNVNEILVVNSLWLFDSISCAEALPATSFKPNSNKQVKELWKLTCKK